MINGILFVSARNNHFIGGIKVKHTLLENTPGPRLILVGGSGVSHGVDSEKLGAEFGLAPVNMGLFAQFGLRYMLNEVRDEIRAGDIVIVIPEYSHFYYFFNGWRGLNELIYVYPKGLKYLDSPSQYGRMLTSFPRFFTEKMSGSNLNALIANVPNKLYDINNGDYVGHLDSKQEFPLKNLPLFHDFIDSSSMNLEEEIMPVLNKFAEEMEQKGARFFFAYPAVPDVQLAANRSRIAEIESHLNTRANFSILDTPAAASLPIDDFYDTVYHPNSEGRVKRTLHLIEVLDHQISRRE